MKLKIDLYGSKCNEYPKLTILYNQTIIYSGYIEESVSLEFELKLQDNSTITFRGIDKLLGQNNKWDTAIDANGEIYADKYLIVNNIWIDNIGMGQEWIRDQWLINDSGKEKFSGGGWYKNGSVSCLIQLPLLDWIIEEKFIKFERHKTMSSADRSGDAKFNYDYIQEKINIIKKIIND